MSEQVLPRSPRDHAFLSPAPGAVYPEGCALCGCLRGTHLGEAPPDAASGDSVRTATSGTVILGYRCGACYSPMLYWMEDGRPKRMFCDNSLCKLWLTDYVLEAEAPPPEPSAASGPKCKRIGGCLKETVGPSAACLCDTGAGASLDAALAEKIREAVPFLRHFHELPPDKECVGLCPTVAALIQQHTAALTREAYEREAEVARGAFKDYEVVRCAELGDMPTHHVYGIRSDGIRVQIARLYLKDHDRALEEERTRAKEMRRELEALHQAADDYFTSHDWPGREREALRAALAFWSDAGDPCGRTDPGPHE